MMEEKYIFPILFGYLLPLALCVVIGVWRLKRLDANPRHVGHLWTLAIIPVFNWVACVTEVGGGIRHGFTYLAWRICERLKR